MVAVTTTQRIDHGTTDLLGLGTPMLGTPTAGPHEDLQSQHITMPEPFMYRQVRSLIPMA